MRQSERGASTRTRSSARSRTARCATPTARFGSAARPSLRADGTATYQLATVADDLDLGITHVIRGSDHRANEEVQQRIARALGGELPEVIHHGLLLGEDGHKLSKRAEHASVADLRDGGHPGRGGARLPRGARAAAARRPPGRRPHPAPRDRRDRRACRRRARGALPGAPVDRARPARRPHPRRGGRARARGSSSPRRRARGRGRADHRALRRAAPPARRSVLDEEDARSSCAS